MRNVKRYAGLIVMGLIRGQVKEAKNLFLRLVH